MALNSNRTYGFETLSLHAGQETSDSATNARAVPVYQTSSYVFDSPEHAANLFGLRQFGNIYTRIMNPTQDAFERRMAALEGGVGALATSSGQAAETLAILNIANAGDEIASSASLYGGTYNLFHYTLPKVGITTRFFDSRHPENLRAAINERTKAVFAETVGNPRLDTLDIRAVADIAHEHGLPLILDNTLPTPYLVQPFKHGADIVVHSATKFIGGHGTSIGGVVVESGRFPWGDGRFPLMTEPVPSYGGLSWWGNFGEYGFLTRLRSEQLRDIGATMTPFNAFLFLIGLETLALRMPVHVANARVVADFLESHPAVSWVNYAGLASSPWRARAERYLPGGPGAVFAFGVKGGRAAGSAFIEGVELASHLANVGDARTLVIHPGSTTHAQLDDDSLLGAGVSPDLIRISVGLEDADDICRDLDRALAKAAP
jgi:O-acetylhomoserine (thiol)-lyase